MRLTIDSLESSAHIAAVMAEFDKPLSDTDVAFLRKEGFSAARGLASSCMGWIWRQWLMDTPKEHIRRNVKFFVERGMEMQGKSSLFRMRPHADLYLLHCAIFASSQTQLKAVAAQVVDASGTITEKPRNDGELYASAWCGMLKYWILNDHERAEQQSQLIWKAYRPPSFSAAARSLVLPWLSGNWKKFVTAQQSDFEKLWARARKDGTVRSEDKRETVVTVQRYPIEQKWCWAHSGLALLAYRQGISVATDPLWLPPPALAMDQLS